MKQQILHFLLRYRAILIFLLFGLLLGYSLLKLQLISNPQPDPGYISSQQTSIQADTITIKASLQTEIDKLIDTPVRVQPNVLGRPDPFNP